MPKCAVVDAAAELQAGATIAPRPGIAPGRRVLYETIRRMLSDQAILGVLK